MPDRIEIALRRFESIRRRNGEVVLPTRLGKELSSWAHDEVCAVVEDAIQRPDFRRLSRWSIDNLSPHAKSEARRLVERVDAALVQGAQQLAALTRKALLRDALAEDCEREREFATSSTGTSRRSSSTTPVATVADFVAARPWHDLVSIRDFFGYVAELNLLDRTAWLGPNSEKIQIGEFLPYANPVLKRPGDLIARSMFIRIDYWLDGLRRLLVRCDGLLAAPTGKMTKLRTELRATLNDVQAPLQKLEEACSHAPEVRMREAAMRLLQLYTAFRPSASLAWLGLDSQPMTIPGLLRYDLEKRADLDLADAIAAALTEIAPLYRTGLDPDETIAEKARSLPLVLIYGPGRRELYWQGTLCDIDWGKRKRAFTLLVALAEKAKRGQAVDECDDLGVSLKDARSDLNRLLPKSMRPVIQVRQKAYKLNLPADDIYVGRFDQEDRLSEADGRIVGKAPA